MLAFKPRQIASHVCKNMKQLRQCSGLYGAGPIRLVLSVVAAVWIALTAAASAAQNSAPLIGNRPLDTMALTLHARADQTLKLQISLQLRNRVALNHLLIALQDPTSPQYHQWLTPAEFDADFGRTSQEVQTITNWLTRQGFQILSTTPNKLDVLGHVGDIERAFGISINSSLDSRHYANITDPQLPSTFINFIGSIEGLDNLRNWQPTIIHPQTNRGFSTPSNASEMSSVKNSSAAGLLQVAVTSDYNQGQGLAFGPQDLQTFYNETPLLGAGTDGGGDCIALVEDSDYNDASPQLFDTNFSLPVANLDRSFPDGSSPGINGDEVETLLDIEWAHTAAPGAAIRVYIGNSASAAIDPITDAIYQAVDDNKCGTISISFEFCGSPNRFYSRTLDPLFAEAAAQGQSVFIASGDQGAAGPAFSVNGCVAGRRRNVSEMAADPNVTSVGGTQFTPIYSSSNDSGSVAEDVWNDNVGSSGGGQSVVFAKPFYQKSLTLSGTKRNVPDVAAGASPTLPGFYLGDDKSGTAVIDCCVGGTSVATPIWAGISQLIVQAGKSRIGNMNPKMYKLGALLDVTQSGLRDVTAGNNSFNGVTGFTAGVGYDRASGLGTPDIATFVAAFTGSSPTSTSPPIATPTSSPLL
jgi:subtilase family serine protease